MHRKAQELAEVKDIRSGRLGMGGQTSMRPEEKGTSREKRAEQTETQSEKQTHAYNKTHPEELRAGQSQQDPESELQRQQLQRCKMHKG